MKGILTVLMMIVLSVSCGTTKTKTLDTKEVIQRDYFISGNEISHMGLDGVGNVYVVEQERVLKKYSSDGTLDKTFDAQSVSYIHSIDVNNSLYILLYYRDAAVITMLDRNLAVLNNIEISEWTQDDITAASLSNDNNIWIYNNSKRKLQKYNIKGKLIFESLDLFGVTNYGTFVNEILENENKIFLTNDSNNIIMLDNLGRFIKDIPYSFDTPIHGSKKSICGKYKVNYACLEITEGLLDEPRDVVNIDDKGTKHILYRLQMYTSYPDGIVRTPIIY